MDTSQVKSLLSAIDMQYIDAHIAVKLYSELLGNVYDRLPPAELQRLMIIGAYLYRHVFDQDSCRKPNPEPAQWRGNLHLH